MGYQTLKAFVKAGLVYNDPLSVYRTLMITLCSAHVTFGDVSIEQGEKIGNELGN